MNRNREKKEIRKDPPMNPIGRITMVEMFISNYEKHLHQYLKDPLIFVIFLWI